MPNPINRRQYDAVFALLKPPEGQERLKQCDIARQTGVSERTVCAISTGKIKRPADKERPRIPPVPRIHDGIEFSLVATYRCPTCGFLVTLAPCLYCHQKGRKTC